MKTKRCGVSTGWMGLLLGVALCISFAPGPVMSAEGINPDADEILRSMSSYLGGTMSFSVNVDIDNEVITQDGQKLQLSGYSTVIIERPDKFNIQRKGMFANAELIFDGKTVTLHGKNLNFYAQIQAPGTIDDAIREVEFETGMDAPGADLLLSDPYAILSSGIKSSSYLGIAFVDGVECHHLAFRKAKVDWQLWVNTGDSPMPMKYVITSKWTTGAPQYEVRFRDWDTNPKIKADQFTFSVPQGAKELESIPVNEMGELTIEEDK